MPDSTNEENLFEDRFLILEELGSGGMGKVYRALQTDADREVALKVLLNEKVKSAEAVARFNREFKLLSRLSHPHIMTVYGMALDKNGNPYAICELLQGQTLSAVIEKEHRLAWDRALKIILQMSQALQYMHEHDILHRDLKPANVMLMASPEKDFVKILDFGLSRLVENEPNTPNITLTGKTVGTAAYSSPEQSVNKADRRSDIYSLGCILFELLAGECLFPAISPASAMWRHATEDAGSRFEAIECKVPSRLLAILEKILQKDPEQRIQSMQELAASLDAILDSPGELVEGRRFQPPYAEGARQAMIAAAVALVMVAATTIAFLRGHWGSARHQNSSTKVSVTQEQHSHEEMQYKNALAQSDTNNGARSIQVANRLEELVNQYTQQGKWAQAEELQTRSLAIKEKAYGSDSKQIIEPMRNLALIMVLRNKQLDAEKLLIRTIEVDQKVFGPNWIEMTPDAKALADLLIQDGKPSEAIPLLNRWLAILKKRNTSDDNAVAEIVQRLGLCFEHEGKIADAIPLFERAVSIYDRDGESTHDAAPAIQQLASCLDAEGKWMKAESLWKRLLTYRERKMELTYPAFSAGMTVLENLSRDSRSDSAHRSDRTLAIRSEVPKLAYDEIADLEFHLAENLFAQGKFLEARPCYESAIAILKNLRPIDRKKLAQSREKLLQCISALATQSHGILPPERDHESGRSGVNGNL